MTILMKIVISTIPQSNEKSFNKLISNLLVSENFSINYIIEIHVRVRCESDTFLCVIMSCNPRSRQSEHKKQCKEDNKRRIAMLVSNKVELIWLACEM